MLIINIFLHKNNAKTRVFSMHDKNNNSYNIYNIVIVDIVAQQSLNSEISNISYCMTIPLISYNKLKTEWLNLD